MHDKSSGHSKNLNAVIFSVTLIPGRLKEYHLDYEYTTSLDLRMQVSKGDDESLA